MRGKIMNDNELTVKNTNYVELMKNSKIIQM